MRDRLLRAALELFTGRGYDQTSLDQVAGAAGFTKGAVYSNFTSKDELFLTLMDQQVGRRIASVREALQRSGGGADSARLVGDRLTRALDEDREWQLLFLDYVLRAARDPVVRKQFVAHAGGSGRWSRAPCASSSTRCPTARAWTPRRSPARFWRCRTASASSASSSRQLCPTTCSACSCRRCSHPGPRSAEPVRTRE